MALKAMLGAHRAQLSMMRHGTQFYSVAACNVATHAGQIGWLDDALRSVVPVSQANTTTLCTCSLIQSHYVFRTAAAIGTLLRTLSVSAN